jgi:hypothetical protein
MEILIDSLSSEQISRIEERMRPRIPSSLQAKCRVGCIEENESVSEAKEREYDAMRKNFEDYRDRLERPHLYGQSDLGFLRDDQSLNKVIEEDRLTLEKYQIEPKQIADRLETIVGKALRTLDLYYRGCIALTERDVRSLYAGGKGGVLIEDRFLFSAAMARGFQHCPFEDRDGNLCDVTLYEYDVAYYGFMDCLLQNVNNGIRIFFPGLIIHLIRDHHFFEGSLKYRVEPEQVIKLLELEPNRDYTPRFEEEITWRICGGSIEVTGVLNAPEETIELADEKVKLYRTGEHCVVVAEQDWEPPESFAIGGITWGEKRVIKKGRHLYSVHRDVFVPL